MLLLLTLIAFVGIITISIHRHKKAKKRKAQLDKSLDFMDDLAEGFKTGDWKPGEVEENLQHIQNLMKELPEITGEDIRDHYGRSTHSSKEN